LINSLGGFLDLFCGPKEGLKGNGFQKRVKGRELILGWGGKEGFY